MKALDLEAVSECTRCPDLGRYHCPAYGSPYAHLMIIGQSPGSTEVDEGEPFVGECGLMLENMLAEVPIAKCDCYITNALKCHPPKNRPGTNKEISTCRKVWLKKEFQYVNPKVVLILGKDAWKAMPERVRDKLEFKHMGKYKTKKRVYLCSFHPGYFIRRGELDQFIHVGSTLRSLLSKVEGEI